MRWPKPKQHCVQQQMPNAQPNVGWHIFPTWWTGYNMSSPLTNQPLVATGDEKSAWFGWPEDQTIETLRADFIAAGSKDEQMKAIDGLQKRFYEHITYINTGQFLTPVAWRNELKGVPEALLFVPWNIEKN